STRYLRNLAINRGQKKFGIPVCAADAASSNPPIVIARAGLMHQTRAIDPASTIAAERIDNPIFSPLVWGHHRPVVIFHCFPRNARVWAPSNDPMSSTGPSADKQVALRVYG